jgi:hypothetical protein
MPGARPSSSRSARKSGTVGLEVVDVAVGIRRGRGGDLLVQLSDQELAHLGIAEPRQQVAQRIARERLGQGHRLGAGRAGRRRLGALAMRRMEAGPQQQEGRGKARCGNPLDLVERRW